MGFNLSDFPDHVQEQVKRKEANARSESGGFIDKQTIWVPHLPPGLNGDDGLINMHWTKYRDLKKLWVDYIFAEQPGKHLGAVHVEYIRKSIQPMDWDNLGASFKVVGDALIENNVIVDDSPKVIKKFEMDWEKADRIRAQGVEIKIQSV